MNSGLCIVLRPGYSPRKRRRRWLWRYLRPLRETDKKKDKRYKWFVQNYGKRCWELDALDPNALRDIVQEEIEGEIEWEAWERCTTVNEAHRESIRHVLDQWKNTKRLK